MREIDLHFAKAHLSRRVDEALAEETVVIARDGTPLLELTPVQAAGKRRTASWSPMPCPS